MKYCIRCWTVQHLGHLCLGPANVRIARYYNKTILAYLTWVFNHDDYAREHRFESRLRELKAHIMYLLYLCRGLAALPFVCWLNRSKHYQFFRYDLAILGSKRKALGTLLLDWDRVPSFNMFKPEYGKEIKIWQKAKKEKT